jgi:hypothetical protein
MSDSSKRFTLRLPAELHQLLLERADADHRSLNREIEFLLWDAFRVDVDAYANTRGRSQLSPVKSSRSTSGRRTSSAAGSPRSD